MKKLYRSPNDNVLTGVCGGLAEYLEVDATVLRLLLVILVICSGVFPGIFLYIVAAFIMPLPPTPAEPEVATEQAVEL